MRGIFQRRRRSADHEYELYPPTQGWWLTLPMIVNTELVDVELLVEPEEVMPLVQAWYRNGSRQDEVSYRLRYGRGQTAHQDRLSSNTGGQSPTCVEKPPSRAPRGRMTEQVAALTQKARPGGPGWRSAGA